MLKRSPRTFLKPIFLSKLPNRIAEAIERCLAPSHSKASLKLIIRTQIRIRLFVGMKQMSVLCVLTFGQHTEEGIVFVFQT